MSMKSKIARMPDAEVTIAQAQPAQIIANGRFTAEDGIPAFKSTKKSIPSVNVSEMGELDAAVEKSVPENVIVAMLMPMISMGEIAG